MKKQYVAEAFGTFCLVFAGTGAAVVNQITDGHLGVVGIGLVFGFIVLAMIYTVGPISGAHINPAVTVGFAAAGRHPWKDVPPYVLSQLAGAIVASISLRLLINQPNALGITLPMGSEWQSFLLELLMTLILMVVILSVSQEDREEGLMAGIAVGATVALEAIFGGPVSGASMNPARSFGPALVSLHFAHHWIYWVAPLSGSLLGVTVYRALTGRPRSVL